MSVGTHSSGRGARRGPYSPLCSPGSGILGGAGAAGCESGAGLKIPYVTEALIGVLRRPSRAAGPGHLASTGARPCRSDRPGCGAGEAFTPVGPAAGATADAPSVGA